MKHRDPVATLLLGFFVPFYTLYWFYATCNELRSRNVPNVPSNSLIITPAILLGAVFVLSFPLSFMSIFLGPVGIILFMLLMLGIEIGCIVLLGIFDYKFSHMIVTVIGYDLSPVALFFILLFVAPVGAYLIQEKLNAIIAYEYAQWYQSQQPPAAPIA